MQKLGNPVPTFLDTTGALLDGGRIYVGAVNSDPESSPLNLFWDESLTIPAAQPLRTLGGYIVNGAAPGSVFFAEDDFAMRVSDTNDAQIFYSPSIYTSTSSFQPLDTDLTAIAALSTTAFGRALLTLANQAALQAAVGYAPFTGGIVTTNITRSGAGAFPYFANPVYTGARIFPVNTGGTDPTSQPGDFWVELL